MIIRKQHIVTTLLLVIAIVLMSVCAVYLPVHLPIDKGVVVIDAGHGGIDGGVTYANMVEAVVNLELAQKLNKILENRGYSVIMTRNSMNALADTKKKDMQKRKEIIEKAKPDIVVSLHINKFTNASRRGVQVFYDDTKNNKLLGEKMQYLINSKINNKYAGRNDLESIGGDYFICKCTKYPTVIIECGFMSNEGDRQLLNNNNYKDELLTVIADGIDSFMLQKVSC